MVNSTPTFTQQPAVINGFSDLMVEIFGDRGKRTRRSRYDCFADEYLCRDRNDC